MVNRDMQDLERCAQNYAENPNDGSARQLLLGSVERSGIMHDRARFSEATRILEDQGLLPKILAGETSRIDNGAYWSTGLGNIWTPFNDGTLNKEELQAVTAHPEKFDALTVFAAQYGQEHFGNIRESGGFVQTLYSGIGTNMMRQYAAEHQADMASRSQGSLEDRYSYASGGACSANESVAAGKAWAHSDSDLLPGQMLVQNQGGKDGFGDLKNFRAEDHRKKSGNFESAETYEKDSQFHENAHEYKVQSGDTGWGIARSYLEQKTGGHVSNARIRAYLNQIEQLNSKDDRGMARIKPGETVYLPNERTSRADELIERVSSVDGACYVKDGYGGAGW